MVKKKRIIISSIFILAGLVAAALLSYRAMKEAKRNQQIAAEVESLQQEAEKIRQDNQNLEERIVYFQTQEFQEREAKEKLNFQKAGEQVVVVRPSPFQEAESERVNEKKENPPAKEERPNYEKWWNHFFKY